MRSRFATADVFTDEQFQGNPVAVVFDAKGFSTERMQAVALEFNYMETAFVLPPRDPAHTAHVRIFTPSREVPFAGHPNLGTAFLLALTAAAPPECFIFEERAGLVQVHLLREEGAVVGAELRTPQALSRHARVAPERAAACLSLPAEDVRTTTHLPLVASVGLPFLLVELASREALRQARPDRTAYDSLLPLDGATSVYAYTRDLGTETGCDLLSRMFTPRMVEDPATGSATTALVALLAEIEGHKTMHLRVRQGVDMGRPSLLLARIEPEAAYIGGHCIAVMEGSLLL